MLSTLYTICLFNWIGSHTPSSPWSVYRRLLGNWSFFCTNTHHQNQSILISSVYIMIWIMNYLYSSVTIRRKEGRRNKPVNAMNLGEKWVGQRRGSRWCFGLRETYQDIKTAWAAGERETAKEQIIIRGTWFQGYYWICWNLLDLVSWFDSFWIIITLIAISPLHYNCNWYGRCRSARGFYMSTQ